MPTCTIRPRQKKDGYEVQYETTVLRYRSFDHALSYATDCMKEAEIVILDDAGNVTQRIPPRSVRHRLGDV